VTIKLTRMLYELNFIRHPDSKNAE